MSFSIGNINIKGKAVLGPMAGNTNYAFRVIAKEHGAALVYAEMVSDKGLNFNNQKTKKMIDVFEDERPVSMQIFGSSVDDMVKAAILIDQNSNCDIIDINMGCPVNKVAKRAEAGASLLRNPQLVYDIVSEVVKHVEKPVTVKIRSGWDSDSINAVEIAKLIEKAGAKAIAIHGRTRAQMYNGKADWQIIKQVKNAVKIPVIGNGDIKTVLDAKRMLDETGCDAVMIARGSLGNPWIFDEVNHYLETGELLEEPSIEEIRKVVFRHIELLRKIKGDHIATLESRTQVAYYLKGMKNSATVKKDLFLCKNIEEVIELITSYFDWLEENK